MTRQPPQKAIDNGHRLEWDPPFASTAHRWTCADCGNTALNYHGNEYGSALTDRCTGAEGGDR